MRPDTREAIAWLLALLIVGVMIALALAAIRASKANAHVPGCHTTACDRRIHAQRARRWCARHERCVWRHRFEAEPYAWRVWASNTAACEGNRTHGHDIATGSMYHGAFQFSLRTAFAAGFRRDPHLTTWWEQGVRAIEWARRAGVGQWPVCGR